MRIDSCSSEGFAAMLASCSPTMFQGSFEEAMVGGIPPKRPVYSIFESSEDTADEEAADVYSDHHVQKKRRLSADQVKSLEKNFEEENKLDPERKLQLARELGLHPRQVAVWFQNRRARWKSKQLEKDYDILKADYDALKRDYEAAIEEREKLQAQVSRLNEKFRTTESDQKPPQEISASQKRENIFKGSSLHTQNHASNESAQSSLGSLMSSNPLVARKRGFSSSNTSDDSEVLDHAESPPSMQHPICTSEHPNLGCADPPSLKSIGKEHYEKLFPHIPAQRSTVKLEDESYPEETNNYLFTVEDQATCFAWWDWP